MQHRTTVILIAVATAAALAAGVFLSHRNSGPAGPSGGPAPPPASSAAPAPAAPTITASDPYRLVALYFRSLEGGDLAGAYAYLGPDLQKTLGYRAFTAGFQGLRVTGYDPASLRVVGAGNISLIVQVEYTVSGPQGTASRTVTLACLNVAPGAPHPDWRIESIGQ